MEGLSPDPEGRRPPARLGAPPHPAAAGAAAVERALSAALPALPAFLAPPPAGGRGPAARPASAVLYLPARGPRPLPSPAALALGASAADGEGEARLRPWAVPVVWVTTGRLTGPLWLGAPALGADTSPSLRWLGRLAELAAVLWRTGAVVPWVALDRRLPEATWHPWVDDPEIGRALAALVQAMPLALAAAQRPPAGAARPEAWRWHAARALLSAAVDALGRHTPTRAGTPRRAPGGPPAGRVRRQTSAWARVARALGAESPQVAAATLPVRRVGERLAAWAAPAREGASVRLSLRLAPTGEEGAWRLTAGIALPSTGGQPLPLAAALEQAPEARTAAERAGVTPLVLARAARAQVERAGACAPALAWALEAAGRGEGVELSPAQALDFLRSDGPALARMGVDVALPAAWRAEARRRLRVEVAAEEGEDGGLGRLSVRWRALAEGEAIAPARLAHAVRRGGGLMAARSGWVEVSERDAALLARLLAAAPEGQGQVEGAALLPLLAEAGGEGGLEVAVADGAGWLAEAERAMAAGAPALAALPPVPALGEGLAGELRPYQEAGVRWLWSMAERGMGALLADDMGLGKTVQAIALVLARHRAGRAGATHPGEEEGPRPTLLVAPTSVLTNWKREFARFAPGLRMAVRHGGGRGRDAGEAVRLARHDVVLTSYALVWRDISLLSRIAWDGVILDEAQAIKNPLTRASRGVRRLGARYRLALTGTPIENRLMDLWALFRFLQPGYLGSAPAFRRRFARPVEEGDAEAARVLRRLVAPFVLRRRKDDPAVLAGLPDKVEVRELCTLTHEQARLYRAVVDGLMAALPGLRGMERRGAVITTLLRLKQILNHPSHYLGEGGPIRPERSGKVVRVREIVQEALDEGDRLLLFTQFVAFGRLLLPLLEEMAGGPVPFVHGGLTRPERDRALSAFQSEDGPPLLLLSLRAGGVGLNLARANRVVHLDRWWNPAVEEQATDRAHRIGQRERVIVHKMVTVDTVEERVDALLEEKRRLAERVVGGGEGWLTELDDEALAELLRLRRREVGG
ncbi:MAG: ATP-dependent helicase [Firmicutes bacterium]|nr:ATP-dependent helicase [Bacillota bacterium]